MKKNTIFILIVIVVTINSIGILFKYFGLDTFFILTGFRFQLSLFLPSFFIFKKYSKDFIINIFRNPSYKKNFFFIFLLILPLLLIFIILLLLQQVAIGDPDYFYEFGISSIADFPIYLAWNSIQLMLFFLFLVYIVSKVKFGSLVVFFVFILLFGYEIIPFKKESFSFYQLISLIFFAAIAGFTVKHFQNIYWLVGFSFAVLWLNFLLFGSSSQMIINMLFASQYDSWTGFFKVGKDYKSFILPAHLLIVNLLIITKLYLGKSKF